MLGINNKEMPTEMQHKATTMPAKWIYKNKAVQASTKL